jgi:hypothetical protein
MCKEATSGTHDKHAVLVSQPLAATCLHAIIDSSTSNTTGKRRIAKAAEQQQTLW